MARQAVRTALKHVLWFCAYGALGVVLTLLVVFVLYLEGRPDLDTWHKAELDEEFTAGSRVSNFEEYLALEDRLFAQLDERVYDRTGPAGDDRVNRYKRGSLSDPQRWTPDWNRSFELPVAAPRASVLLLHGLSDSPYSLRALGERLHAEGVSWQRLESFGLEYRYVALMLQDKLSREAMTEELETAIWHYAKRQLSFLRRLERSGLPIRWISTPEEAATIIT